MGTVYVVWYDGARRHRENCTLLSRADGHMTFRDAENVEFTITEDQLVLMK